MFDIFKKKKPVDEVDDFLGRNADAISASIPKKPFRMQVQFAVDGLADEEKVVLHMASRIMAAKVAVATPTSEVEVRECAKESLVYAVVLVEELKRGMRR